MSSQPPFLNPANLLTLARLPLAALIWRSRRRSHFAALMVAAGVSDMLDGWVARRMPSGPHPAGAWLDPVCDKTFVLSALGSVTLARRQPIWVPVLIATREIFQLPLVSYYMSEREHGPLDLKAALPGKLATVTQFSAMAAVLARPTWVRPLSYLACAVGAFASGYYFQRMRVEARSPRAPRFDLQTQPITEGALPRSA